MSLRLVGLCGVDESSGDPGLLATVASRWQRVELGVLFRPGFQGKKRYPEIEWVRTLCSQQQKIQLCAHLCGSAVDAVLQGDVSFIKETLVPLGFRRVQLNATKRNGCETVSLDQAKVFHVCTQIPGIEVIIQSNEETASLWEKKETTKEIPRNLSLLFDASCGEGKDLDLSWVMQAVDRSILSWRPSGRIGFAGGLKPSNAQDVVRELREKYDWAGGVWIDMESGIRTESDHFDVGKAWAVCASIDEVGWDYTTPSSKDEYERLRAEQLKTLPGTAKVSNHAVLAHKITLLRDRRTKPRDFRTILKEITFYLGYEVTRDLPLRQRHDCIASNGVYVGADKAVRLDAKVALIPIMRAGLGMVEPMLDMLPNAAVHQIGMFKRGGAYDRPIEYYSRLPRSGGKDCDLAIILDPVIATSRTVHSVISKLKQWGARRIVILGVLASADGLNSLAADHPSVTVHIAQVDDGLTESGDLLPGLGDPGDRIYSSAKLESDFVTQAVQRLPSSSQLDTFDLTPPPSPILLGERSIKKDAPKVPQMTSIEPPSFTMDERDSATQLTTHDGGFGPAPARMDWGASSAELRGPVIATTRHGPQRNAIGAHAGGYSIYRALAVASGGLDTSVMPKLELTTPAVRIGPHASWFDPTKIVTMDPFGHDVHASFGGWLNKGYDIRPTIAVTRAHVELPECKEALRCGLLEADDLILAESGTSVVTKAAIEPVWYLPGVAARFGVSERLVRDSLFSQTNSMYPELITRDDLKLFLPPIGGMTVYIWGDVATIPDPNVELTCRVHDECNGSDVFFSDICTCRPYLAHAVIECIKCAQRGGNGIVIYFRKEGRALGEVTKYLVYNMRKRREGGDTASEYFNCTNDVAGVTDTRFQALMPDVLHWLGITKIHRFISMSDMKHDAITQSGIEIVERVEIPPELIPADAQVEIAAKVHVGYHGGKSYAVSEDQLNETKGREYY